jgi:predicted dehydrogenase
VPKIRDFLDAIQAGASPETRGEDNFRSLAMVFGAIDSAKSGRHVSISA